MLGVAFSILSCSNQAVFTAVSQGVAMAQPRLTLVWLRNELRTHDNFLLHAAAERGGVVLPVYVFDSGEVGKTAKSPLTGAAKTGPFRTKFLLESVSNMRENLRLKCSSNLLVASGKPEHIFSTLIKGLLADAKTENLCISVLCSQSVCSEEQRTEELVNSALTAGLRDINSSGNSPLEKIWDGTMYHPLDLKEHASMDMPNDLKDTFTPWRIDVEKAKTPVQEPLPEPEVLTLPPGNVLETITAALATNPDVKGGLDYLPSLGELGVSQPSSAEPDARGDYFAPIGGETAGLARVKKYVWDEDRLKEYFDTRNGMIGQAYSTKFAPWLARGCISPRLVATECRRYEKKRGIANKSTYWVIFELTWRDYFVFYAQKYGRRLFFKDGIKGRPKGYGWQDNATQLSAWKEGRTGVPLIDANMRELKATGFMSNRGRQNVASYLTLDLQLDWRLGAEHFEDLLVDYTPEANWGNWHAAAGLAGGRVNKFNPVKQGKDYDKDGQYIRLWCSELEHVPTRKIHEPWTMSAEEQQTAKCIIGVDYPVPLTKHSFGHTTPTFRSGGVQNFNVARDIKKRWKAGDD